MCTNRWVFILQTHNTCTTDTQHLHTSSWSIWVWVMKVLFFFFFLLCFSLSLYHCYIYSTLCDYQPYMFLGRRPWLFHQSKSKVTKKLLTHPTVPWLWCNMDDPRPFCHLGCWQSEKQLCLRGDTGVQNRPNWLFGWKWDRGRFWHFNISCNCSVTYFACIMYLTCRIHQ